VRRPGCRGSAIRSVHIEKREPGSRTPRTIPVMQNPQVRKKHSQTPCTSMSLLPLPRDLSESSSVLAAVTQGQENAGVGYKAGKSDTPSVSLSTLKLRVRTHWAKFSCCHSSLMGCGFASKAKSLIGPPVFLQLDSGNNAEYLIVKSIKSRASEIASS
jgi:hypothetical protein